MPTIFSLFTAINDYPAISGYMNLKGCIDGAEEIEEALRAIFGRKNDWVSSSLYGQKATYRNVISGFKDHLGQAKRGDTALFYFSGHGSTFESGAEEFNKYFPTKKQETLVLYDSRMEKGYDLIDKELNALIYELSQQECEIVLIVDSCHSGSITRTNIENTKLLKKSLLASERKRELSTYLDGYYSKKMERGEDLLLRFPKHILLSACRDDESAFEIEIDGKSKELFTDSLLKVLRRRSGSISYTELFLGYKTIMENSGDRQTPRIEPYGGFDPYRSFLENKEMENAKKYIVRHIDGEGWKIHAGILDGISPFSLKAPEFLIESEKKTARASKISLKESTLDLSGLDTSKEYSAKLISILVDRIMVQLIADPVIPSKLLDKNHSAYYYLNTDLEFPAQYKLIVENQRLELIRLSDNIVVLNEDNWGNLETYLPCVFQKVFLYEYLLKLQNPSCSNLDKEFSVRFELDSIEQEDPMNIRIPLKGKGAHRKFKITIQTNSNYTYYIYPILLSNDYAINTCDRIELKLKNKPIELLKNEIYIPEKNEYNHCSDYVFILLTQEELEIGLLNQDSLKEGNNVRGESKLPENPLIEKKEWFIKKISIYSYLDTK